VSTTLTAIPHSLPKMPPGGSTPEGQRMGRESEDAGFERMDLVCSGESTLPAGQMGLKNLLLGRKKPSDGSKRQDGLEPNNLTNG
jgi:hypothetical protein